MARRNTLNLIAQIGSQQGLSPANIAAMQATTTVESGGNPSAVGDGGTSYGLFQHHVGGAGGSTHAAAKRYLNPTTSITERAKWFKRNNITDGAGAAALQRPADPSGYAVKVNNALRGLGNQLNAPVRTSQQSAPNDQSHPQSGQPSFAQSYLKSYLGYDKDPVRSQLFDQFYTEPSLPSSTETADPASSEGSRSQTASGHRGGALRDYRDILALGKQWGLRIDGDGQTTGGSHKRGSKHYQSKAVDFGDAKNDPAKLAAFAKYLARNAGMLGLSDIFYSPLGFSVDNGRRTSYLEDGHNDHLHVDVM